MSAVLVSLPYAVETRATTYLHPSGDVERWDWYATDHNGRVVDHIRWAVKASDYATQAAAEWAGRRALRAWAAQVREHWTPRA